MQMSHYTELDNRYEMSRKIIHDFKKHLDTLEELKSQKDEKAYDYGVMVEKEIESLFICFKCSNKVLSIVMSQKIALAEANNIKVTTDTQDIPLNFISDLDITALFANIWDNAIEACCKIDNENRFIEFVMKKVNGFILITVKNSFDGNIKTDNEHFISTKNNHVGVGLSIIKSISEKYNGLFVEEHTDSEFKIEITLPNQ
ncbi:MAG: ATP-binding protein [Eubacterium sp.]|nr:ATP-binding protein [Eubacterium sp.]